MIYNILDYGAKTDGSLCTAKIQKAIDDCFLNGGGEVVIPKGVFLTGGLRLRSGITLHFLENAILRGSTNPEDYNTYINDQIEPISEEEINTFVSTIKPGAKVGRSCFPHSRWNNAIIRAINATNISIIGEKGSEIDGQNCCDELGEENYRGPHAINMWFCENITLSGYTIRDSANWAHAIQNSRNITVNNITVLGGHDGFDVRTCDNIIIENSRFLTGDDCIAGFDNIGVTVRDCYFESACSIFRFGGADILIENCEGVAPATYGHRWGLTDEEKRNRAPSTNCRHNCLTVFLYYCDNRANIRKTPGNILIRNCRFKGPDAILSIPFGHKWCCNRSLDNITFESCTFNGVCKPIELKCPSEEPLALLQMKNCVVVPREKWENISFIEGENVQKIRLTNVSTSGFTDPKILCDPKTDVCID